MKVLPLQNYIAVGYTQSHSWSVLKAQFGDGYKQTAANGLNNKRSKISITYKNLNEDLFAIVMDFFDSLNGAEKFEFTPRGSATLVCIIGDNEMTITETAAQFDTDLTWRDISVTLEIM